MVAVALFVRQAIDDDGDGGGGTSSARVVTCARGLEVVCDALEDVEVRVEDAAATAAALVAGDGAEVGTWVTTSAWVEVVDARVEHDLGAPELLARSPVVVGIVPARAEAVQALCVAAVWRCLGDRVGRPWSELGGEAGWGPLWTGLPDADSATGLAVLGAVVTGFFGRQDFAANDFAAEDLPSWLGNLAERSGGRDPDPAATLVTRAGQYSAVATHAAAVAPLDPGRITALGAEPAVDVEVVAVTAPDARVPDLDDARDALQRDGWEPAAGPAPARYKPGVLAALHTLWTEVT